MLVKVETNAPVSEDRANGLRNVLATMIGKVAGVAPRDARVEIHGNRTMRMAATGDDPIAHVEIRNVELPKEKSKELTGSICPALDEYLGIQDCRVYIAVVSARNSMWRVNGAADW